MRLLVGLLLLFACGKIDAAPVTSLAFRPDGTTLVAASGEKILLCSPLTGAVFDAIERAEMRIATVAFNPAGTVLAAGGGTPGENGEVRLLDWSKKKWAGSFSGAADIITSVAFSPDGNRLAIGCADDTARIHAIENHGERLVEQLVVTAHSGPVQAAAVSPDGKLLVTVSTDRSLKIWSAADGKLLRSLGQHTDAIHSLAFRPLAAGQPQCATGGDDRTVRIWQPAIGRMMRIVRGHEGAVLALVYAPDGKSLFSAGAEGIVRQIDAESDAILRQWKVSSDWIHALAISPDGRYLATGDWSGNVGVKSIR